MAGFEIQPLSVALSADGDATGSITLTDSSGVPVGAIVTLVATAVPTLTLQVASNNTTSGVVRLRYTVGATKGAARYDGPDLSSYTVAASATIYLDGQFIYSVNYAQTLNN